MPIADHRLIKTMLNAQPIRLVFFAGAGGIREQKTDRAWDSFILSYLGPYGYVAMA